MSDIGVVPKLLTALHSVRLWILAGLGGAGYAAIFLPGFGGVDVTAFKKQWGPWFWLDAIVFSVLAAACAIDLIARQRRAVARRRRTRDEHRYYRIYEPLFAELMKIHITTSSFTGAPYLSQRLSNARIAFSSIKRRWPATKAGWHAIWDKKHSAPTGEVDYGGDFPMDKIRRTVRAELSYCDDELLHLLNWADDTRMNEGTPDGVLTAEDVRLRQHIVDERLRLRGRLNR